MPDVLSRSDLFNTFAAEVLARAQARSTGRQVTAGEVFTPGSDINLIGAGGSAMGEEVIRQLVRGLRATSSSGSQGAEKDRWAADRYGSAVVRKTASAARVHVALARPTGTFGAFTYPSGSKVSTPGGIEYETQAAGVFAGASVGPITVEVRAVNAGLAGNVAANTITTKVTPSADPTMTVTNPEPAAGGDASETDAAFQARVDAYFATLARGTLAAVVFGALTVPGIRQATVIEERTESGVLTGRMYLYIADANGQANRAIAAVVELALREYRCGGIPVVVVGGIPTFVAITYSLQFETGIDTIAAFDAVRSATVARVNQTAPQATLQRSLLFEIARSVRGVIVNANAVTAPAGDVVPTPGSGQTIRTTTDLVTNA